MYTTYHFKSAEDINLEAINIIKNTFKSNAVIVTVEDDSIISIPESQKEFVRNSVKKYNASPELLIDEEEAWKIINAE